MKTYALRLHPGEDLIPALEALAAVEALEAACVLTCVGSLRKAVLRYANTPRAATLEGHFEIVSLTGVFSRHGGHYHIALSDGEGKAYGAHLLEGCEVYTTAEFVIAALDGQSFLRTHDPETGFPELEITRTS